MTQIAVVAIQDLDRGMILAPERYDPRRRVAASADDRPLTEVARVTAEQTSSASLDANAHYLVLDTSDARRGLIPASKSSVPHAQVGSSKKIVQAGDVIISRLRPYLRQVAFVDRDVAPADVTILCSTEFFVLRSIDGRSIAFLVPFLLSDNVQAALAAAQEGGHHPRFVASALAGLHLPPNLIAQRDVLSERVEDAARALRAAESLLGQAMLEVASPVGDADDHDGCRD